MRTQDDLANDYTSARPRLVRMAYAVLGSYAEAEDVVSECWIRAAAAHEVEPIDDIHAWATVAVARRSLDVLRSARVRRETYVGPWLPEPLLGAVADGTNPADKVSLDDSISYALLVMLESLSPAERTAWVLHEVFGMAFAEVAQVVGRSSPAVRQLAARARKHLAAAAPRQVVDSVQHREVFTAFVAAAASGDLTGLMNLLDPNVVLTGDGGGEVTAARRPINGPNKVARFLLGIVSQRDQYDQVELVNVNGALGLVIMNKEKLRIVLSITVVDGQVMRVDLVNSPRKLRGVEMGWQR